MDVSKGGRGNKAPYRQETVKVPTEIKKSISHIVKLAREMIADGRLNDVADLNYFLESVEDNLHSLKSRKIDL